MTTTQQITPCRACREMTEDLYCERCRTERVMLSHTLAELNTGFGMVQNAEHWKGPIDATVKVTLEQAIAIMNAVIFYTATKAELEILDGDALDADPRGSHMMRFTAAGYWAGPAC